MTRSATAWRRLKRHQWVNSVWLLSLTAWCLRGHVPDVPALLMRLLGW